MADQNGPMAFHPRGDRSTYHLVRSKKRRKTLSLQIKEDDLNRGTSIVMIPTVRPPHETIDLHNEIHVLVESRQPGLKWFHASDGFDYFVENGYLYSTFETIYV